MEAERAVYLKSLKMKCGAPGYTLVFLSYLQKERSALSPAQGQRII